MAASLLEMLESLAPGTAFRQALERIIQQGHGALIVLGEGPAVAAVSSGGFQLAITVFTPARLAELAKMDGGIVVSDDGERILAANVHFMPDPHLPTDETGARHRTAERLAAQTGKPVVAVSEDRRIATLFYAAEKTELARPTSVAARVNERLTTLERLRRRLDESGQQLTRAEVADLATYRDVVLTIQRAEVVRRIGAAIERDAASLGEEGSMVMLQAADLVRGVESLRDLVVRDHTRPRRSHAVREAIEALEVIPTEELDDWARVGKAVGFPDLDESADAAGVRLLAGLGRIPEGTQIDLTRRFKGQRRLLQATQEELERTPGIGPARAAALRAHFDRLVDAVAHWTPELG